MYNHYNKNLKRNTSDLINLSISRAEKYLRKAGLKGKQLGVAFKRQRPIHNFTVDFFSAEIGLIIEVDGSPHDVKGAYARYRQDKLEELGYIVIRFQEGEVIHRYPDVENKILRAIEVLKSRVE
jgi:very-short-patch-repair endonuclease